MRLIDADRLKEMVRQTIEVGEWKEVICALIDRQPTIFDKDGVIEKIKILSAGIVLNTDICSDYAEGYVKATKKIIDIIEKG